jgi:hypothetical protein
VPSSRVGEDSSRGVQHGADGVAFLAAHPSCAATGSIGRCGAARRCAILETLGIPRPLLLAAFHPHQSSLPFSRKFAAGPDTQPDEAGAAPIGRAPPRRSRARNLAEQARGALRRCYDCGKCTSVCPVNLGAASIRRAVSGSWLRIPARFQSPWDA